MATYSGTPRDWVAGETVTAALLNSDVRDPLAALTGSWNSYTPTLTQSATVTKTVSLAQYVRVGKLVICSGLLSATSAGTAGTAITVGLPVDIAYTGTSYRPIGQGNIYDSSPGTMYPAIAVTIAGSANQFNFITTNDTTSNKVGQTPSFALGSGDLVMWTIMYEAA